MAERNTRIICMDELFTKTKLDKGAATHRSSSI